MDVSFSFSFFMSISTIITAAGKNSRMRKDQLSRNIELKNKLILPFENKTVIETTIDNALSANIDECIVVLGHYASEIKEAIFDNYKGSVKFVINDPVDVVYQYHFTMDCQKSVLILHYALLQTSQQCQLKLLIVLLK